MVKIFETEPTTLGALESPEYDQERRDYLGMSLIGHECNRYIWFTFRWAFTEKFSARMIRLFNRGHREEEVMVKELEKIGISCHSFQQEFSTADGHIRGHCDGMADGVIEAPKTRHLLEFKTMSERYFKEVCKVGVKQAKPIYYGQCQIGMLGYKLKRALFMAVNKNDDSYYIERIRFDREYAEGLRLKGLSLINTNEPPIKVYKPTWYLCKFCSARFICHHDVKYEVNCRTCIHSQPVKDAKWVCNYHMTELDRDDQINACKEHTQITE